MHALQKLDTTTKDCLCVVLANKADDMRPERPPNHRLASILDLRWTFRDHDAVCIPQCLNPPTQPEAVCLRSTTWAKKRIFRPRYLHSAELRQ